MYARTLMSTFAEWGSQGLSKFLNESSVTFIDETDGKDLKKREIYFHSFLELLFLWVFNYFFFLFISKLILCHYN